MSPEDCFVCERIARGFKPDKATARMHDEYHWLRRCKLEREPVDHPPETSTPEHPYRRTQEQSR